MVTVLLIMILTCKDANSFCVFVTFVSCLIESYPSSTTWTKMHLSYNSYLTSVADPGLCTPNDGRYLKYYWINILDNFERLLFCFNTFGVRQTSSISLRALDPDTVRILPDPGWFPGSRTSMERLTQKRRQIILKNVFNIILIIFHKWGYTSFLPKKNGLCMIWYFHV